jgi:hypothetical protein
VFVGFYEFVVRNNTLTEIEVFYLYLMNAKMMLQLTHTGAPFGDGPASAVGPIVTTLDTPGESYNAK